MYRRNRSRYCCGDHAVRRGDTCTTIIAHNGFAAVPPKDKFNIVKTLQHNYEITGMTGDGVNDAAALKEAEVGIAVVAATDVAKQAASIILLRFGLENIISLITDGRQTSAHNQLGRKQNF